MILKLKNIFPQLKTLKPAILCVIIFILFAFSACSDDPVTPIEPEFDPPRFDWTIYYVDRLDYISMWCPDSSNIYLVNIDLDMITHLRDGLRVDYPFSGFKPVYITGLSNNDIYIIGFDLLSSGHPAKLKRFDGSAFSDIDIKVPNNSNLIIYTGLAKSPNEIWFTTDKFLLKYDGTGFTDYPLKDTLENIYSIFYDRQNKLQYISYSPHNFYEFTVRLSEYQNGSWNVIYSYTFDTTKNLIGLLEFGGNKFGIHRIGRQCLYSFESSFTELQCLSPYSYAEGRIIAGQSFDNYSAVIFGIDKLNPQSICNWNGQKWSREISFVLFSNTSTRLAQYVNDDLYFFKADNEPEARTYLYRGIRKKQQ
jgi:hypothetical protein